MAIPSVLELHCPDPRWRAVLDVTAWHCNACGIKLDLVGQWGLRGGVRLFTCAFGSSAASLYTACGGGLAYGSGSGANGCCGSAVLLRGVGPDASAINYL